MEDFLKVGVIVRAHGLRGEVKVYPTTDEPERFLELSGVILDNGKVRRELTIENVRFFKNLVIVKFEEINDCNEAEGYRQAELWIPREEGAALLEDEYYIADLLGMKVILEDGSDLGVLKDVLETGANDVYVVKTAQGREVLLPAIHECILDVDVEQGIMKVHLMKGLLE